MKCEHKHLNLAAKHLSTGDKLTTVALALGFERPEIERCIYDSPRDIWGASSKILSLWWGRVITDENRWQQLYTALQQVLPPHEMEALDAKIRPQNYGKF